MSSTATKSAVTFQSSATNAAGATTTGSTVDLTTTLGAVVTALITNGGTGPTVGCDCIVQVSADGSTWREFTRQTAGTTASTAYTFAVELPAPLLYARTVFVGNTAQSVTIAAEAHVIASIG